MTERDIAPEVRDLLRLSINTYEKLNILLLLRRRQVSLSVAEVATSLGLDVRDARQTLEGLVERELVAGVPPDQFWFRPRSKDQRDAVDALARLFEEEPVRVVQWMSRQAFDRMHSTAASAFAEVVLSGRRRR